MIEKNTTHTYKAIIFDFYGVICTSVDLQWASQHGISEDEMYEIKTRSTHRADRGLASADDVYDAFGERAGMPKDAVHEEWLKLAGIDADVIRIATTLKKNHKIALCSNAFSFIREIFGRTNVDKLFDAVVISSEVGFAKPDPQMYEYTLKQLNVAPEETIFIDDSSTNVESARNVGMTAILFTSAEQLQKDLADVGVL